ncbi:MAG: hypothetical protein J6W00_07335 [Lentisphaeria bacterium]|nr:hypothetical protein [Lentisphaeria bacterium]
MNKITRILFAVTAFAVNLAAQEPITFSDFIAEDGSGIEKLLKLQKERCDKKEFFTTHDTVSDAWEQVELITTLLDQAVMKKVRKLPFDQGMIVLKSHQQWWKYFDSTPSLPDVNGSARGIFILMGDFLRIKNRWEAVKLPYEQYLVYAKIANFCQVRLDCGTYRMRFGEVCLKKEAGWAYDAKSVKTFGKYYHDFPIGILPESCCRTPGNYIAVVSSAQKFYLCIWDFSGIPMAVYSLADAKTIQSVSVTEQKTVEVVYKNSDKVQQKSMFVINKINENKILTENKQ